MTIREHSRQAAVRPAFSLNGIVEKYGLVLVLVVVIVFFSAVLPETFFTARNAQSVASTNAVLAILALAVVLPLAVGQFDLSVGFQLGFAQSASAALIIWMGMSPVVVAPLIILAGLAIGLINGLLVARLSLNAFITTLATGILLQGTTQLITNGSAVFGRMPDWWLAVGRIYLGPVPIALLYVLVLAVILWLAIEYTTWGRRAVATGDNPKAAVLMAIPAERVTIEAFAASGGLCALGGLLSVIILGSADPNVGVNYMLPAYAAAFLGASSIRPGRFNAWGTVIAVYTLAAGITGLQQLGAPFFIEQFFYGSALLAAIVLARFARQRRTNEQAG